MESLNAVQTSAWSTLQAMLQKPVQGRTPTSPESPAPSPKATQSATSASKVEQGGTLNVEKTILSAVLGRISQVRDEILKEFDSLFKAPTQGTSQSSSFEATLSTSQSSYRGLSLTQGEDGATLSLASIENRSLSFSLSGVLKDGNKEVSVNIEVTLQESFIQTLQLNQNTSTRPDSIGVAPSEKVKMIDPLVIDYLGVGTELSDKSFSFDLDSDGTPDQISTLKRGSGFLALDKNNDGVINDGNELFGTQSGDGFADLALYDLNGDGKIDKNDPIYASLRIWTPKEDGTSRLMGLGEAGIGAIYLNAKESEKLMQGSSGNILGIQRKSAGFERLDGTEGEIHHIDFAKLSATQANQNQALKNHNLSTYAHSIPLGQSVNTEEEEKEIFSLQLAELWLSLDRSFSSSKELSAYNLLNETIFKGQLLEMSEANFIQGSLTRAQSLLR